MSSVDQKSQIATSGNKYLRKIPNRADIDGESRFVTVDVYCVLEAFPSPNGAVAHAVKKVLCPGLRGGKSQVQDLQEAIDSLQRGIAIIKQQEELHAKEEEESGEEVNHSGPEAGTEEKVITAEEISAFLR